MSKFSMKKEQVAVTCNGVSGVGRCCLREAELSEKVLSLLAPGLFFF